MNKSWLLLQQTCLLLLLIPLCQPTALGQTRDIPNEHHCWGRFTPGAWCLARIVTQSFDKDGKLLGTTTTVERVTLVSVRRGYATLRIESVLEVGGKTFAAPVRTVSQGYHGEEIGNRTNLEELGAGNAHVEGNPIACQVKQYQIQNDDHRKQVRVYYSNQVAPYILRRETITTLGNDPEPTYQNALQVVALDRPHEVLDQIKSTSHLETVKKNGKSITTTAAIHARDIPGEVVSYQSNEKDKEGHLIRQSHMELIDYGYSEPEDELQETHRRSRRKDKRRSRRQN